VRLQSVSLCDTLGLVIISFRHKGLRLFWEIGSTRGINAEHSKKLNLILDSLAVASGPEDLTQAYFRLHLLKGERLGFWSIWVNGNWRVTFRFVGTDIELVDYEDYH
jgi:proteic killer suppression protein